jgi:cytochrome c6
MSVPGIKISKEEKVKPRMARAMKIWTVFPMLAVFAAITLFSIVARAADGESAKKIFLEKCAMCHGADAAGNTPIAKELKVPDLRSPQTQKLADPELIKIVTEGKGKMPPFKEKLSEEQIRELVAYIRELRKKTN